MDVAGPAIPVGGPVGPASWCKPRRQLPMVSGSNVAASAAGCRRRVAYLGSRHVVPVLSASVQAVGRRARRPRRDAGAGRCGCRRRAARCRGVRRLCQQSVGLRCDPARLGRRPRRQPNRSRTHRAHRSRDLFPARAPGSATAGDRVHPDRGKFQSMGTGQRPGSGVQPAEPIRDQGDERGRW
jgi:hypothetical protein